MFFLKNLHDPDLPWHIKTGEYILKTRQIPTTDLFSFARQTEQIPFIGKFILSQYWLGQIILASIYGLFGVAGLVVMRALIFTTIIAVVRSLLNEKGFILSLFVSGFYTAYIFSGYDSARPVIFTFLLSALLLWQLEQYRKTSNLRYIAYIPLQLMVWANLHGGFIFGLLLLSIYLFAAGLNRFLSFLKDNVRNEQTIPLLVVTCLAYLCAVVNPNGLQAILYAFTTQSSGMFAFVGEYKSPFDFNGVYIDTLIKFWCLMPVSLFCIGFAMKRRQILPLLLAGIPAFLALGAIRFIPFMVLSASVAIVHFPIEKRTINFESKRVYGFLCFFLIAFILFTFYRLPQTLFKFVDTSNFPVKAVNFLKGNNLWGNIFASYNKSSYLILQLYPDSKIYFDSRFISPERVKSGFTMQGMLQPASDKKRLIKSAFAQGSNSFLLSDNAKQKFLSDSREWFEGFDESGAEIVLHEAMNAFTGEIYMLPLQLLSEDNWKLVYLDGLVMVFVKDIPKFQDIISRHSKPKGLIFDQIILEGIAGQRKGNPDFTANLAFGYLAKGRTDRYVERLLLDVLDRNPSNFAANIYKEIFQQIMEGKDPLRAQGK